MKIIVDSIKNNNINDFKKNINNISDSEISIFLINYENLFSDCEFIYFQMLCEKINFSSDIVKLVTHVINFKDLKYFLTLLKNENVIKKIERSNINVLNLITEICSIDNLEIILKSQIKFSEEQIKEGFFKSANQQNINIFNYYLNNYYYIFYKPEKNFYRCLGKLNIDFLKIYIENDFFTQNSYMEEITMKMYRENKFDKFIYLMDKNIINFKIINLIINNKTPFMKYVNAILEHKNSVHLIPNGFKLKYDNPELQKAINLSKIKFKLDIF